MKTLALGTTLALALVASASAAAPEAAPPRYGQLVAGSPTQIPMKKTPAAIGGREKAPGIFPQKSDQSYGPNIQATEVAELPATDLPAEGAPERTQLRTCFSETYHRDLETLRQQAGEGLDWIDAATLSPSLTLYKKTSDMPNGGVTAIHSERFEEGDEGPALAGREKRGPRLEMTDAWVDPVTRGARVIAQKSMPLSLVAKSSFGVRVYASRDDAAATKKVQFVLVPDDRNRAVTTQLFGVRNASDGGMVQSGCGHLRIGMPIDDEGSTARLRTTVLIEEAPAAEKGGADEVVAVPRFKGRFGKRRMRTAPPQVRESKVRDLVTQVSLSRTSRDPEPVISVSFGWDGRESTAQHF